MSMSLSQNRRREGDRHILLRGRAQMSQSSTVLGSKERVPLGIQLNTDGTQLQ
jgi:hypothetical protein